MADPPNVATRLPTRVLVAEDEAMISMTLGHMLEDLGCRLVGPAATLDEAMALVRAGEIDCALVNGKLRGERTLALTDLLNTMCVPFALCTGYQTSAIRPEDQRGLVLHKPFARADLARILAQLGAILTPRD